MRSDDDDIDDRDLDISKPLPPNGDLTTVDWLICAFCSGIGCIIGIVRLIQGRPGEAK